MSRRRPKPRPANPLAIARARAAERQLARDPANWGVDRDALTLATNTEVEVRPDKAGQTLRARRCDVFDLFFARGRLSQAALDAVVQLHASGGGVSAYAERIDCARDGADLTEARCGAGRRIAAALSFAGPVSARLLLAVCEFDAALGRCADWRAVVQRETGERLADAQGAILRAACENLAGAFAIMDRRPGRA